MAPNTWLAPFSFLMEGVLLSIVACFGLIGNLLSFIILSTQEAHKTFHNLLLLLSIFDMVSIQTYEISSDFFSTRISLQNRCSRLDFFCLGLPCYICLSFCPAKTDYRPAGNFSPPFSASNSSYCSYWNGKILVLQENKNNNSSLPILPAFLSSQLSSHNLYYRLDLFTVL